MSGVQHIEIGKDEADQRLDRWLRRRFPGLGQGRIEKMCRKGELRLDGSRVKPSTRVAPGKVVRVPPLQLDEKPATKPVTETVSDADSRMMQKAVLYEDDEVIVINKPPGIPTQGGQGQSRHIDGLTEALRSKGQDKPRLVHRLDKDTSGVLVLAKTQRAASWLTKAFRSRATRKVYWALVAGQPKPDMGTIRFGLLKAGGKGHEKMRCIHPDDVDETDGAKRAVSDYAVLHSLGKRVSWVALVPVTGRTHQLRAHMAEIGHPIIGDGKYGGSSQENLGDGWGAGIGGDVSRKMHLHARSVELHYPERDRTISVSAPLPDHMARTWKQFGWAEGEVPADPFEDLT